MQTGVVPKVPFLLDAFTYKMIVSDYYFLYNMKYTLSKEYYSLYHLLVFGGLWRYIQVGMLPFRELALVIPTTCGISIVVFFVFVLLLLFYFVSISLSFACVCVYACFVLPFSPL